jgi:RNA polymerase sigma-70 factor, ECF subfamily
LTPSEAPDETLVTAVAGGDLKAFDVLVDRFSHRVYGICYRYFGDPQDAEDATQETFLTVLRRAETFAGTARFSTWLYRVATNTCNDIARKRGRRPRTVPIEDRHADPDRTVEDALASAELGAALREALLGIDAAQRRAVVLHDVIGLPYDLIAEREGVAVGTVKSRIHRGHAALAGLLRDLDTTGVEPSAPPTPPTSR